MSKAIIGKKVRVKRTWRVIDGRRVYGFKLFREIDHLLTQFSEAFGRYESTAFAADILFPDLNREDRAAVEKLIRDTSTTPPARSAPADSPDKPA